MSNFKRLIVLTGLYGAALCSMDAVADATAVARVTARVVPAVMASFPGSVILSDVAVGGGVANDGVTNMSTSAADAAAKFNIRGAGNFSYVMSVSSSVDVSDSEATDIKLEKFQISAGGELVTSDEERELHIRAELEKQNDGYTGPYRGSVYITANFN